MRSISPSQEPPEPFEYDPWSFWVVERGSDQEAALEEHLSALSAKFQSACAILRGEVGSREADADDPGILRIAKHNAIEDIKTCFSVCLTVRREGTLLQGSDEGFDAYVDSHLEEVDVQSDLEEVDKLFETMTESFDELYKAVDDPLSPTGGESSIGREVTTPEDGGTRAGRADIGEVDSDVLMVIELLMTSYDLQWGNSYTYRADLQRRSSAASPSASEDAGANGAR